MKLKTIKVLGVLALGLLLSFCGKKDPKLGVGPVSKVELAESVNSTMVEEGKNLFQLKCSACHEIGKRKVGPAMHGITQRRAPEWIMNMILNPVEMIKEDLQAKELFETYLVPMTFQNISQDDTRKILEYFRDEDSKPLKTEAETGQKK